MMKNRPAFYLLAVLLVLPGCMAEQRPAVTQYTLAPDLSTLITPVAESETRGTILRIARINSTPALSSTGMLYVTTQHEHNQYAYSRWSSAPPAMLLAVFQQAVEKSGMYRAVVSQASRAQADRVLESRLYDLAHHLNDDGSSTAVLKLSFDLVDNDSKSVIDSQLFDVSVPATSTSAPAGVAALNEAVAQVARQLVDWLRQADQADAK